MNTIQSSGMSPSSGIQNHDGISSAVLKKSPDSKQQNLPSQKILLENSPASLLKKISSQDYLNAGLMEKREMERLLMMAFPVQERQYPPHFSVEKGRVMDIFA